MAIADTIKGYVAIIRKAYKNRGTRSAKTQKAVDNFQAAAVALGMAVLDDIRRPTPTKKGARTMKKAPPKPSKPVKATKEEKNEKKKGMC